MAKRVRTIGSIRLELLTKAREAALCAIKTFNDPLIKFKSESFIVLMIIAWTYLLHAYYRKTGVDYRYSHALGGRRRFDRTKYGAIKHWELERCLNDPNCPIDAETQKNLRFLIGLRHEIEHQMTVSLDNYLSGRYQACAVNFNDYLKNLFGSQFSLDQHLAYSIQFLEMSEEQFRRAPAGAVVPHKLLAYIEAFDKDLTSEEYNSPRYSYRLCFTKKLVNRPGQADRVVEFVDPNSELARCIEKEYWVKKEVERPKFRAKDVVAAVREAGFKKFRINPEHVEMWRKENAKDPAKGFGTDIAGAWYWYESWIERCKALCESAGDRYREAAE